MAQPGLDQQQEFLRIGYANALLPYALRGKQADFPEQGPVVNVRNHDPKAGAFRQCLNAGKRGYLLLTARQVARDLPFTLPDLRSRLNALPNVTLGTPDDALLMGVLAKQFADRQLRISPEVLTFAAQHSWKEITSQFNNLPFLWMGCRWRAGAPLP